MKAKGFRVIVGTHICTPKANILGCKDFEATTLKRARQFATNFATFYKPVAQVKLDKWIYGGVRRTLRQAVGASYIEVWLISLDVDIVELYEKYRQP